jgi:predicted nuclease of predicted toxin-antitoxin system
VKLLFDQNLSRHLVTRLADLFPDSSHVASLGLDTASDREVWDYAADQGFAIASKDSDFRQLAFLLGPPPKSIWLRVGNRSTSAIAMLLTESAEAIEEFAKSEESALLVLPNLDE